MTLSQDKMPLYLLDPLSGGTSAALICLISIPSPGALRPLTPVLNSIASPCLCASVVNCSHLARTGHPVHRSPRGPLQTRTYRRRRRLRGGRRPDHDGAVGALRRFAERLAGVRPAELRG